MPGSQVKNSDAIASELLNGVATGHFVYPLELVHSGRTSVASRVRDRSGANDNRSLCFVSGEFAALKSNGAVSARK